MRKVEPSPDLDRFRTVVDEEVRLVADMAGGLPDLVMENLASCVVAQVDYGFDVRWSPNWARPPHPHVWWEKNPARGTEFFAECLMCGETTAHRTEDERDAWYAAHRADSHGSTQIGISELRAATLAILDEAEARLGPVVDLGADHYWTLDEDEMFEVGSEPTRGLVGQLSDDVESVRGTLASSEKPQVWHDLKHLSGILLRLSVLDRERPAGGGDGSWHGDSRL